MLETQKPREQAGRATLENFRLQIRSAAIAALSILENKDVDRVYCDLHDDFITRKKTSTGHTYSFYQVKTKDKQSAQWGTLDLFGIPERTSKEYKKMPPEEKNNKIKNSFIGKQIVNSIKFSSHCEKTIFQTNINNNDKATEVIDDIKSGKFLNTVCKTLLSDFHKIFEIESKDTLSEEEIKEIFKKINFETDLTYLKKNSLDFEIYTAHTIYKYSEIELTPKEIKEIAINLLHLIEKKSSGIILEFTKENIEMFSGVSIEDLLSMLSLSKDAYQALLDGGDPTALKTASIIQRTLKSAGASEDVIEFCTKCKIKWDKWILDNRHLMLEIDQLALKEQIRSIIHSSTKIDGSLLLSNLRPELADPIEKLKKINFTADEEIIMGAIFAEIVRQKS